MSDPICVATPVIGEEERRNIGEVLDSGLFLQGEFVEEFERKWAEYVGVEHGIAVTNGTVAIQLTLNALGLEPGDEVIVPSLTFGSTATAVVHQAGVPVFADIERHTYTLDPADLGRCLTERTEAIVPVHIYGHPAEMDDILDFADEHDLIVVEDAAQAHGASYKGATVGSIGDAGCFSFYATKNITTGEGGIVTTDDAELADSIRTLRNHGMADRDHHVTLGYNFRMSELNGAIGAVQVDKLDRFNKRREEISERLFEELAGIDWLTPATVRDHVEHAYFWTPFEVNPHVIGLSGKDVRERLLERGLETRHRYVEPLYEQPVFAEHRGFNSDFPWSANENDRSYDLELDNVEAVVGNVIGLPNHPKLSQVDLDRIIEIVRKFDNEIDDISAEAGEGKR